MLDTNISQVPNGRAGDSHSIVFASINTAFVLTVTPSSTGNIDPAWFESATQSFSPVKQARPNRQYIKSYSPKKPLPETIIFSPPEATPVKGAIAMTDMGG